MQALPEYKIHSILHEGVQTIIYRGETPVYPTPIILKILKAEYPSLEAITCLKHEYQIRQNLEHENIVKVLNLQTFNHRLGLVLEDFGGESLEKVIVKQEIPQHKCLEIAIKLTKALVYLHKKQIIHKDIKPSNIIINQELGIVKLTDFGIASRLDKELPQINNLNSVEGTIAYMSPEQTGRMNRILDYRTDFYSLGITLYEMFTQKLPFPSEDPLEVVYSHIAVQPTPPEQLNPEIPPAISAIIMKLMAKNSEDRYQSATGLLADLENCLNQLESTGKITNFIPGHFDILSQLLIHQKLYGREDQVKELLAAFERVSQGNRELILVSGYSGIGKSAVVNEINKPVTRQRGYFISGKFDQFKRNIPYKPLIQAFGSLMGQLLTGNAVELEEWKNKILRVLGTNGQVIIDVIPEVELIIGKQPEVPKLGAAESQNRFHRMFKEFIYVFTEKTHPLVIFLDDLQWADPATLKLIQLLISEPESKYLLLIGAYRDNEVNSTHPLTKFISEIQKNGIAVNNIWLQALTISNVTQLIAETLNDGERITALAELLCNKTGGNPFFLIQLLNALYQENLLKFDFESNSWQWSVEEIQTIGIIDKSVVELIAERIQKLPEASQKVLKLAACLGDRFTLNVLSVVNEESPLATANELYFALQAGVILPLSEADKIPLLFNEEDGEVSQAKLENLQSKITKVGYKFLHDRVQQAAYSLIPQSQKKATHLKIGKLLLENTEMAEIETNIFDIVNQLNFGIDRIEEESEKTELAKLNLMAGRKAKAATASETAFKYLQIARQLLPENSWKTEYKFTLELYEIAAEVAYLSGNFKQMDSLVDTVLQKATSLLDKVKVYEVKIQACQAQNQLLVAVETALQVLQLLEISFPATPTNLDIQQGLEETALIWQEKSIEDLIDLPIMTDAYKLAAMRILVSVTSAAYNAIPALLPLIVFQQVKVSIQYGNSPLSAYSYAFYGSILCALVGDIDAGYRFGKVSLALLEKLDAKEIQVSTSLLVNGIVKHWKELLKEPLKDFISIYNLGLETGEFEYAAYSAFYHCYYSYLMAENLPGVELEMKSYSEAIINLKQQTVFNYNQVYHQAVLNLMGRSLNRHLLMGEAYDERRMIPLHLDAKDGTALAHLYFNKLILCYLFKELAQGLENAELTEKYLSSAIGQVVVPIFHFYDSLVRLAMFDAATTAEQKLILERVTANQAKLEKWAHYAPMNHWHKVYLVEAERLRVQGAQLAAMEYYDLAIKGAAKNGYIQEEALACELAGEFYRALDKEIIYQAYLTKAYYGYIHWGAIAKVKDLEAKHGFLVTQTRIEEPVKIDVTKTTANSNTNSNLNDYLDLTTFIKASQAIACEIVLENLLGKLIKILLENAAAQKGILLLFKGDRLCLEARGTVTEDEVTILPSIPVENSQDLPSSIVNYVLRSQKNLVLNNATTAANFNSDPYIREFQTKSILCLPIIYQSKLQGIIYLENNLATGAFTQERVEVLKVLVSQVAIAIENARLYAREQEKTQQLEQSLQQLQQAQLHLIQTEKMSSLGNLVAGVAHEINNPIGFITGNIDQTSAAVQDLIDYLRLYQEKFPDPVAEIEDKAEEIEIEYLLSDLPKMLESMKNGTERIKNISISLRTFSRADSGCKVSANIHEGIDSTLMILQYRLKAKDYRPAIQVIKEYGDIPPVKCYFGQLNQVFVNILSNAIDSIEEVNQGRSYAEIEADPNQIVINTQLSEDQQSVIIKIKDSGKGISAEDKARIFDHLFTTKSVGKGTGLGLSISRQIVAENHGGSLTCESVLGEGALFAIAIPLNSD
jgi:histidine kinase